MGRAYISPTLILLTIRSAIYVNGEICLQPSYSRLMLDAHLQSCLKSAAFDEWNLSDKQLLLELPIEEEESNAVRHVRQAIFSRASPTPLKTEVKLAALSSDVFRNLLGMSYHVDGGFVNTDKFLSVASGNSVPVGTVVLTHRYGGHQFGVWAGQLGDGRAHILGELTNRDGKRWELQLKGSGRTPYSRDGDGRAVIRSSVREFIASEAMHFLGVPTSRAATLVLSDDLVMRDLFYDGSFKHERAAIVLRVAPSWFRFGSLEILTKEDEVDVLRQLVDFIIVHHFPHISINETDRYLILYAEIVEQTAHLIAKWQSVGFAHGVCNTDNFSIISITIDYGPFGFMDAYNPEMVPNASDDESRYSYKNQPMVGYYNLDKLREAFLPLIPVQKHSVLMQILSGYEDQYTSYFLDMFRGKLGLSGVEDMDEYLIHSLLDIMEETRSDFTLTFRHLSEWSLNFSDLAKSKTRLWTLSKLQSNENFWKWVELYKERLSLSGISESERQRSMHQVNPRYIPRNWILQQVIQEVEGDNFTLLHQTLDIFRKPFSEQKNAEDLKYANPPPPWAENIKVSCSS